MVTTDISQLTAECNNWKTSLRKYREEFMKSNHRLQEVAARPIPRANLQDIEHYQNQFHIQLINIHDLKQAIKEHERKADFVMNSDKGISESVWSTHEELFEQYQHLEHTLQELSDDFEKFIKRTLQ